MRGAKRDVPLQAGFIAAVSALSLPFVGYEAFERLTCTADCDPSFAALGGLGLAVLGLMTLIPTALGLGALVAYVGMAVTGVVLLIMHGPVSLVSVYAIPIVISAWRPGRLSAYYLGRRRAAERPLHTSSQVVVR